MSKYTLKVPTGMYESNTLYELYWEIMKHRFWHLVKHKRWMD